MTIRSKALALPVPSVTVRARARAEGLWLYGYGAFQGAVAAADSFLLFFAAGVLGASASLVGLVDAIESLGYTAGAVVIGLVMRRFSQHRALLILLIGAVSIPLFLFSFVSSLTFAIMLAAFFGFVWAPTSILTPMVATQNVPRARWSGVLAQLSQFGALGGAAGMVVSSLWLAVSQHLAQPEIGVRLLWVVLGSVALLSAFVVHSLLTGSHQPGSRRASPSAVGNWVANQGQGGGSPTALATPVATMARPRLLSDQLLWYYVLSFVLFLGLGMSFSGLHTYMVRDLRLPLAAAMTAVFGFRLAIYVGSRAANKGLMQARPLQMQCLAVLGRAMLVMVLALLGFVLPAALAFPMILAIVSLWGGLTAFLNVTGLLVVTQLAPVQCKGQAISLYVVVANGAVVLGALLAGMLGGIVGFEAMFLLAGAVTAGATLCLLRA